MLPCEVEGDLEAAAVVDGTVGVGVNQRRMAMRKIANVLEATWGSGFSLNDDLKTRNNIYQPHVSSLGNKIKEKKVELGTTA